MAGANQEAIKIECKCTVLALILILDSSQRDPWESSPC